MKEIVKFIEGKSVLDVGFGNVNAEWCKTIISSCKSYSGIELNPNLVKKLLRKGYKAYYGDIKIIDLERTFEVVISGETIEHVQDQQSFIKGLKLHVKKNGLVILTTPNSNSAMTFISNLILGTVLETTEHVIAHRETTLTNLLRENNLEVVGVFYYNNYNYAKRIGWKFFVIGLLELFYRVAIFIFPKTAMVLCVVAKKRERGR